MAGEIIYQQRVAQSEMGAIPIRQGQIIFTTDTKKIFLDVDDSNRIEMVPSTDVSYAAAQALSATQQATARNNINVYSKEETVQQIELYDEGHPIQFQAMIDENGILYFGTETTILEGDEVEY